MHQVTLRQVTVFPPIVVSEAVHMKMFVQDSSRAVEAKAALAIGPEPQLSEVLIHALPEWEVDRVPDNVAALAAVKARPFKVVVTGEQTSGRADLELLRKIRVVRPHTRLIVLTTEGTPSDVIACMREYAFSYFSKPFSAPSLEIMLRRAAEEPCWDDGIEVLEATPEWIRVAARCDLGTADRLLQFLHELTDLPENEKQQLGTAFREILLNAMEYGGRFDPTQYVEISYIRARHMVLCRVKDPGEGFSLEEIQHAAIANPPEDPLRHFVIREAQGLRGGGFGVLMARSLVDDLIYSEKGNEALLVKYLESTQLSA
jgi:anti-sigma regulatory factor (Ser/Thr protein kinase)/ActR/RegA family two-component response regulator